MQKRGIPNEQFPTKGGVVSYSDWQGLQDRRRWWEHSKKACVTSTTVGSFMTERLLTIVHWRFDIGIPASQLACTLKLAILHALTFLSAGEGLFRS